MPSLQLTVRKWQLIDAAVDNMVNTETVKLDPDGLAATGDHIRKSAIHQICGDGDWPPADTTHEIALSEAEWDLALSVLGRSISVKKDLGKSDQAALLTNLVEEIKGKLPASE